MPLANLCLMMGKVTLCWDPGPQIGHSLMGWGGMKAPDQPATRDRESSIILGENANQEVLKGPALDSSITTPKRKQPDKSDGETMTRKRRVSLNEYLLTASPSLRHSSNLAQPTDERKRTMSHGATPARTKKTPKRRINKKANQVGLDQPLIRQIFSLKEKTVNGTGNEGDDNVGEK